MTALPRTLLAVTCLAALAVTGCSSGSTTAKSSPSTAPSSVGSSGQPSTSATTTAPPAQSAIAGDWAGTYTSTSTPGATGTFRMTFTVTGNRVSGPIQIDNSACVGRGIITGTLNGNQITFGAVHAAQQITYTGVISGNTMSGTYSAPRCGRATGTWRAAHT